MSWNHRVVRQIIDGEEFFGIHEAYYGKDGEVDGWTENAVPASDESLTDLRVTLERMLAALDKPAIDAETGEEIQPKH